MSRRIVAEKRYPQPDPVFGSYLVSLLLTRILKQGKRTIAQKIVNDTFEIIQTRTNENPLVIFETAVKKVSPEMEVRARRRGKAVYQVPEPVSVFRGTTLSIRWLLKAAKQKSNRAFSARLADEIIDAYKGTGSAIKRREEVHKMAEANKAFSHMRQKKRRIWNLNKNKRPRKKLTQGNKLLKKVLIEIANNKLDANQTQTNKVEKTIIPDPLKKLQFDIVQVNGRGKWRVRNPKVES